MKNIFSAPICISALSLGFSLLNQNVYAQRDSLKLDPLVVNKEFKVDLQDAIKLPTNPNPEIPDIKTPVLTYTVPQKQLTIKPTYQVQKPVSINKEGSGLTKLKNNYLKLGYGNFNTPLAEFYMNTLRSKSFQLGINAKHISSSSAPNNQKYNRTEGGIHAKKFYKKHVLSGRLGYERDGVYYYASPVIPFFDPSPVFQNFDFGAGLESMPKEAKDFRYKLNGYAGNYSARSNFTQNENNYGIEGIFSRTIQDLDPLELYLGVDYISNTVPGIAIDRLYIRANPRIHLKMDNLRLHLGFNATQYSDNAKGNKFYFQPVAEAEYHVVPSRVTVFAGITGGVDKNTLKGFSRENQFVNLNTIQYRNNINKFELYAGTKGNITGKTGYLLKAGIRNVENMHFYLPDSLLLTHHVVYDTGVTNLSYVTAELSYQVSESFRLAAVGNLYKYNLDYLLDHYQRPTADFRINGTYNIGDKIYLRADVFAINGRPVKFLNETGSGKLKGFADFNAGAEYRYKKNISLFMNVNNFTSNKYQRWYGYPVYGINVIGGLTLTF